LPDVPAFPSKRSARHEIDPHCRGDRERVARALVRRIRTEQQRTYRCIARNPVAGDRRADEPELHVERPGRLLRQPELRRRRIELGELPSGERGWQHRLGDDRRRFE
jgi:hypothetical protein